MGLAIPSQILAILTFPGVVMHEVMEQFFCRRLGVAVLDVCYFRFGTPPGYVSHEPKLHFRELLWISMGPFLVNSLLGALMAFPAVLTAWEFQVSTTSSWILAWLGLSIAAHALPNSDSTTALWQAVRGHQASFATRLIAILFVGLARGVAAGRVVGLDILFGMAVVAAPPALLLFFLR